MVVPNNYWFFLLKNDHFGVWNGGTTILGNTQFGLPSKITPAVGSRTVWTASWDRPVRRDSAPTRAATAARSRGGQTVGTPFLGDGIFWGIWGGVLMEFLGGIFGGSHCFRQMFVVRLESLFLGKKLAFLSCVIQNLIAVEMSPCFIFHISRHKGPNFQRFLLSLEQWSILAGIPCWLRPLSKGSIKRNGRAPRSHTPENERMTMENQPFKRCIKMYPLLKMVMFHCDVSFPGGGGKFAKSQTSSW